jgi:hypothetical protein
MVFDVMILQCSTYLSLFMARMLHSLQMGAFLVVRMVLLLATYALSHRYSRKYLAFGIELIKLLHIFYLSSCLVWCQYGALHIWKK